MADGITITVSGPAACGKSTIIAEIEAVLTAKGLTVSIDDPDGFPPKGQAVRDCVISNIDTTVKIVQVQEARVPEPA